MRNVVLVTAPTEHGPAMVALIRRLTAPHFPVLGFPGRCFACTVDRWALNAVVLARLSEVLVYEHPYGLILNSHRVAA